MTPPHVATRLTSVVGDSDQVHHRPLSTEVVRLAGRRRDESEGGS